MQNIIEVDRLAHRFGERTALDGISFNVERGEVFGLLGPNGAGKTTTVRLLNGLYSPAAGSMRVAGFDPQIQGREVRQRCGVLTETPALYERLSAADNLHCFAVMAGIPEAGISARLMDLLEYFGLQNRAKDRVSSFSKGMKQRLALARALLAKPEILFLDEPTSGLDPESAQQVHALIVEICRDEGRTVFLCTHNLFEAQRLCSRVAVMAKGSFRAVGSIEELRAQVAPGFRVEIELLEKPASRLTQGLTELPGVEGINHNGCLVSARITERQIIADIVAQLVGAGLRVLRVEPQEASLEEIYFQLQNGGKDGQL